MADDVLFEVETPLGFAVAATATAWEWISRGKHPEMIGRVSDVRRTLESPDEVRGSLTEPDVYLFYRVEGVRQFFVS